MPDPILGMLSQAGFFGQPWQPQRPNLNFGGVPGMGNFGGGALGMLMQPYLSSMAQSNNMMGLQFMGTQNLYDSMQAQQLMLDRQAAMTQAAQADKLQQIRMAQGFTSMMGGQWTDGHAASANRLGDVLAGMSPVLATMLPDHYDRMFGMRGSAAVMASGIFQGGRFASDPVSGFPGMSGQSAGYIAKGLYENLYGSDQAMRQMRGVSAGQTGQLYDELSRRGFMGGSDMSDNVRGAIGGIPGGGDYIREDEIKRIGGRMKNLAGAVAAMRDIFGDAGRPDAPMREIINGLQALTQGGLANMSPGQLQQTVRNTQQLARMASVSLGGALQLSAQGAGIADSMGLDRAFVPAATQHALATAAAYVGSGLDRAIVGGLDKEALMSVDQQLSLSAANSVAGKHLNAVLAMRSMFGFRKGFKGSALDAAAEAIDRGDTEFTFGGQTMSTVLDDQALMGLGKQVGISEGDVTRLLNSPRLLQRFGAASPGAMMAARGHQTRLDFMPVIQSAVTQALREKGIGNAAGIGAAIGNSFFDIALDANAGNRGHQLAGAIDQDLLGDASFDDVAAAIGTGLGAAEEEFGERGFTTEGVNALGSRILRRRQRRIAQIAKSRGDLAHGLAGLGQGGFMRNFMDFVGDGKNATAAQFLIKVFGGGVDFDAVKQAIGGADAEALEKGLSGVIPAFNELMDPQTTDSRRDDLTKQVGNDLGQLLPLIERLNPEARRLLRQGMANSDEALLGAFGFLPEAARDKLQKALSSASPEQRLRMLDAAHHFSATKGVPGLASMLKDLGMAGNLGEAGIMDSGDPEKIINTFIGEGGLKAAGLAAQQVTLSPDTILQIVGKLEFDRDGIMKMTGVGSPANRSSTRST